VICAPASKAFELVLQDGGETAALPVRAGERGWVKTKNRDHWRWEMEREGASKIPRERQFV
jgi:hypothetical protein